MDFYKIKYEETLKKLKTKEEGLTKKEVNKRLEKGGQNILEEIKRKSNLKKFINQFNDLMIIVLCISSVVSFIISYINKDSYIDSIVIIVIVILNAILGFIQELKADKSIEELKKLQVTKTRVKRDGVIEIIDSKDLVVGDIIYLEAGDKVPADARILSQVSLKCDESSLTGESLPVEKNEKLIKKEVSLQERSNMIYSGTSVIYGKCSAVITSTGMNTEFGKIAKSLNNETKEITPLEKKINGISKFLSVIIAVIIVIMFIVGMLKEMKLKEVLLLSISLAVAAIPEGLPAVITIMLSLGVSSMAKKKAIIRKMSSVETLGCTEIICSDKTGTITQNKMTVREIYFDNKIHSVKEMNDNNFLELVALNNDVEKTNGEYIGEPTEIALYKLAEKGIINIHELRNKYVRVGEIPFDSERKMMSTINKYGKKIKVITKGSFDSIIKCSTKIYEDGKIKKINANRKKELKEIEKNLSNKAYRVLAFAYKDMKSNNLDEKIESDLVFVGMTCMIDPPREDVKEAIKACVSANIKPIMITGDSIDTAVAIAKEIGILKNKKEAITGEELDKLSKEELKEKVKEISVYARVSPMNKVDIINAWKANNKVVAMTGDGVNDAPALKSAMIGVGMGITGTEVSKSVSDIILSDDSFSTIVNAIREGRRIFDNIRNVLVYLLTGNIAEILIVFIGMLFGYEIFLPIQLLYINLITDSIPAIALAFEPEADDIMKRKVRKKDSSFFTPFLLSKMFSSAILKSFVVLLVFFTNIKFYGVNGAITMSFFSIILTEIVFAYSCRNLKKNIAFNGLLKNKYMNKSILLLMVLQAIVFFTPVKEIFNITSLSLIQIVYCLLVVITVFMIDEVTKKIIVKKFKD